MFPFKKLHAIIRKRALEEKKTFTEFFVSILYNHNNQSFSNNNSNYSFKAKIENHIEPLTTAYFSKKSMNKCNNKQYACTDRLSKQLNKNI